ncbi:transcription factor GTE7-like isoform X2 [Malania oleifera]|uniref:transcription factor GTE7-like isoform X2 n=1 Tax=Malania oleifera TaxID=397392 RepID=UPI0025AE5E66|nr:transcription factor GTE7-like isoform X2 [Malania oleifera]
MHMASAVLASRNEPCWEERKVYMRKYTNSNNRRPKFNSNPNPNPNSNPNHSRQIHEHPSGKAHARQTEGSPAAAVPPAPSDDSSSLNRKSISLNERKESSSPHAAYVTFDLATYSRRELKELKKRLILELEQVRNLRNRIESRSGYPLVSSQHSGSYGGRDATSAVRPPPLQLANSLDSQSVAASKERRTPKANQHRTPSDFVIGKNKIPPVENQKVSGTKRPQAFGSGKDPKRPAPESGADKLVSSMMRRCGQILTKLMKHKHGWVFNTPVDVVGLGLHDYNQIIKHPMDLGTVKTKLGKDQYASPLDFASDVRLTFNNALMYNPKGHDVYFMAEALLSLFDEMFNPAYKKFEEEQRRVVAVEEAQVRPRAWVPSPTSAPSVAPAPASETLRRADPPQVQAALSNASPPQLPAAAPAPAQVPAQAAKHLVAPRSVKLPKPKAKDPNKRQMNFEEKAKLGMNLQNLPPEKMDQLVHIIKKRNGHLAQDGDEIELDIEAVDTETLWELDRFVSNYKKMVSKIKRQGLINNQVAAAQFNKSPVASDAVEAVQKSKKVGEAGEEDVDIGEDIPMGNFPPVEIEKDTGYASSRSSSSSSSSSSSDSSSSDSDSGSSSGSDSDADSVQSPFVESKEAPGT